MIKPSTSKKMEEMTKLSTSKENVRNDQTHHK